MRIWLLEPYYTGSHRAWVDGYARHSAHQVTVLSMPGRWWKWRMHGAAVTLARQARDLLAAGHQRPDLLLVTDMLDLATFLALSRDWAAGLPVALYMHENQLTYPLLTTGAAGPPRGKDGARDLHYAFTNYTSMLAADAVLFNSRYHLGAWFEALPDMLAAFPDFRELETTSRLKARSSVLPLGLQLRDLELWRPCKRPRTLTGATPIILWNHRWEHDKDPAAFFAALEALMEEGLRFQVALCGPTSARPRDSFLPDRRRLGDRVLQWGKLPWSDYVAWLWRADIVVSTARHDFFGAAVVEAIYCRCRPVLPNALAYPEHIPVEHHRDCLYDGQEGLVTLLREAVKQPDLPLSNAIAGYDWEAIAPQYDQTLYAIAASSSKRPTVIACGPLSVSSTS
jgi:glycosyltransferase involved in cell wall biosynthesis